ncbi:MAG: tetratricopeptide repeat protein [Thermoanaerobaculia bacterium]
MSRRLEGDLDTIVLSALRKDASKRYAGAAQLAADIHSYLGGRPITARPETVSYVIGKFVRRHRVGVGAAAAIALLLIGATVLTSLLSLRLSRAIAGVDRERQKAERVAGFLTELFETSDPVARLGEEVSTRSVLDRGAEQIRTELAAEPEVQADLMMVIGTAYRNLGHFEPAVELFEEALAVRRELFEESHPSVAEPLVALGPTLREQGELELAEQVLRQAVEVHEKLQDTTSPELGTALDELGVIQFYAGRYPESEETLRRALALRRETLGTEHADTATSMNDLALALRYQAKYDEAESLFRESLEVGQRVLDPEHPDVATKMMNLAGNLEKQNQFEEAESLYREALERRRRIYGERHPEVATALHNLALMLQSLSTLERSNHRLDEAEANARLALDITQEYRGPDHSVTGQRLSLLAGIVGDRGALPEAADLSGKALAILVTGLGPNHPSTAIATGNHAVRLRRSGDLEAAEAEYRLATERCRAAFGNDHPTTAKAIGNFAVFLNGQGRYESAELLLREALGIQTAMLGEDHSDVTIARLRLGISLRELQRFDEAEKMLLSALDVLEGGSGTPFLLQAAWRHLARLYDAMGRPDDAAIYKARLDAGEASGTK